MTGQKRRVRLPEHGRTLCKAHSRTTGEPCGNPPMDGQAVCRMHGGSTRASRDKAEQRIREAADPAAAKLVELLSGKKVPYSVQLAAARDLLDRAGLTAKHVVEIETPIYLQMLGEGDASIVVDIPDATPRHPGGPSVIAGEVVNGEVMALHEGRTPGAPGALVEEFYDGGRPASTPAPSSSRPRDRHGRPVPARRDA